MMISAASRPPLIISTEPSHVDLHRLKDLYAACNISGHRLRREGAAEPVDPRKLRIAVANSFVVVSVFCRPIDSSSSGAFIQRMLPLTHWNGELVGFGRASSDSSLTASIHDVMVIPSLRRLGIGRMILKRLIRVLTSKDIYDIAALCDKNERLFFGACGFGDDMLNSTTMMYTRSSSNNAHQGQLIL
uniref:N-acetyltransferase domain-containing protein n=1 Tax=Kalanchoe fedtschenkoi TaxID=63787 RepID=A0A7N1A9I7_KALFE